MSIQATIAAAITIIDTDAGFGVGADNTRTYDAYNKLEVLNAGSTPPVSKYSCAQVAMSGGDGKRRSPRSGRSQRRDVDRRERPEGSICPVLQSRDERE
jgi:hypothetical protein